jgi:hypothetical protein
MPSGGTLPVAEAALSGRSAALSTARRVVPPARRGRQDRAVIHEVDESLRTLLKREVVNGSDIEVGFEAPTREWSSKRSSPVVNLFLYDIREDGAQRQQGLIRERGPDGRVVRDREPIRKLKLSYLVTAWTQRPEDEHRLLGLLLECLLKFDTLPIDVLAGSLAENTTIVALSVGAPSVEDRHVSDLWTAIGGELRPALDVVAIVPIQPGIPRQPAPPVLERTRLNVRRPGGSEETGPRRVRRPRPEAAPVEDREEVVSAGEAEDDFDAPRPPNRLPRGRTFRVRDVQW